MKKISEIPFAKYQKSTISDVDRQTSMEFLYQMSNDPPEVIDSFSYFWVTGQRKTFFMKQNMTHKLDSSQGHIFLGDGRESIFLTVTTGYRVFESQNIERFEEP